MTANRSRIGTGTGGRAPRVFSAVLASVLVLALLPGSAFAASRPPVSVPSATLMTIDGQQIWARKPNAPRRVASTIKMLNALVVMENASLDDTVVVAAKAAAIDNGDVGLYKGQKLTVRQLLQMMLVASANDAAEALAIHIAGSEKAYVRMMNEKAAEIGLKNTRAADPHGLSKKEKSTAQDLSVLARYVMADPELRTIVAMKRVSVPRRKGKARWYRSTDALLGKYRGIEGVKTGFTNPAGYCFVAAAKRGDVELVAVVLGAKSNAARFSEARKLLDWGFKHYVPAPVVVPSGDTSGTPTASSAVPAFSQQATHVYAQLAELDGGGDSSVPTVTVIPAY